MTKAKGMNCQECGKELPIDNNFYSFGCYAKNRIKERGGYRDIITKSIINLIETTHHRRHNGKEI